MKLTIVIPALNEEEAIGSTIERCLDARREIVAQSPVDDVEIIVVSDGSTDRTAEIASGYGDVRVIVFESNRGYGAAIKKGFEEGCGELVGFLDADGTCDPRFFETLCTALIEENASVALGSRMGPDSHMPGVRWLGNRIYALILSALSNRVVVDTASGMRVIRRDALVRLYPLPDGLHFTPAMTARVLMDEHMTLVERPMPYNERIGESKLKLVRDGLRFLNTILEMTLMWRPAKVFLSLAMVCLATMLLLAGHPIEMWLSRGRLQEDMIYRLLFCSLLGTIGTMLISAGVIADNLHRLIAPDAKPPSFTAALLDRTYRFAGLTIVLGMSAPLLVWLVGPGLWTRLTSGYVDLHWSRVVLAGLIAFCLSQMLITVLIANILRFHTARRSTLGAQRSAKREHVVSSTPGESASKPTMSIAPSPLGVGSSIG